MRAEDERWSVVTSSSADGKTFFLSLPASISQSVLHAHRSVDDNSSSPATYHPLKVIFAAMMLAINDAMRIHGWPFKHVVTRDLHKKAKRKRDSEDDLLDERLVKGEVEQSSTTVSDVQAETLRRCKKRQSMDSDCKYRCIS